METHINALYSYCTLNKVDKAVAVDLFANNMNRTANRTLKQILTQLELDFCKKSLTSAPSPLHGEAEPSHSAKERDSQTWTTYQRKFC